jgi:maleate cis-trans isomerase
LLLEPYSQFVVLKIKEYKEQKGTKIITFREIELEELP